MLRSPKTVGSLFTIQNDLVRFDFGAGANGFNWVGLSAIERKVAGDVIGKHRLIVNVRHLWEIVCVRPTRDGLTEKFKVVTPASDTFTAEIFQGPEVATTVASTSVAPTTVPPTTLIAEDPTLEPGAILLRLQWPGVNVDGDAADLSKDRLWVKVEFELRVDEPFLRSRIDARWVRNNSPDNAIPGRYAIWRIRFPILDVAPASALDPSDEVSLIDALGQDYLVVPENHGVLCENPTAAARGDASLGLFGAMASRNAPRPGATWRQSYPGLASTQAMGYVAKNSGRGFLLGCLDHGGHMKDLEAGGQPGSVWMHMIQIPEWCYVVGNRPNGFSGSIYGDSPAEFEASMAQAPWVGQDIDLSVSESVPNTRALDAGDTTPAGDHVASLGLARLGFMWLGTLGDNVLKSLWLGYVSPYDVAIAPITAHGAEKWNGVGQVWREICDIPDSVFPLLEKRSAAANHPAAAATAVLEIDASVNDGQEPLFGLIDADMGLAVASEAGITDKVDDLLSKKTVVADRAIVSDTPVIGGDPDVEGPLYAEDGSRSVVPYAGPTEGHGYLRLYGSSGFYVSPKQIQRRWFFNNPESWRDGVVKFEDFDPLAAGVQAGDIVVLVTRHTYTRWGRVLRTAASNSESAQTDNPIRIVQEVRDDGSVVVGRYQSGSLVREGYPLGLCERLADGHFEVEILRREINLQTYGTPEATTRGLRVIVRLAAADVDAYFPRGSMRWAEVVECADGKTLQFRDLYTETDSSNVTYAYLEVAGATAADLTDATLRIHKQVEPLSLLEDSPVGKMLVLQGVSLNATSRMIEFASTDDVDALLNNGIIGFAQPLVAEAVEAQFQIYSIESSAGRVLGAADDIIGEGRRFIDDGYAQEVGGGFKAKVRAGYLLELIGATEPDNMIPFVVTEVLSESQIELDREMATESGLSYRVVRKGDLLRDLRSRRVDARNWRSGPRALRADGGDRVRFLSVGWVADLSSPITGIFGVDSTSWAALGANPFVPATSSNLTTYKTNRGVRRPSQEFVVAEVISESELRISPGWEPEDRTFSVTFDDVGVKTFEKNALQYCIVRDDRSIAEVQTFSGISPAITGWARSLASTAIFAIVRGWHANLLGHDQPDFRPARGDFLSILGGLSWRLAPAIDPLAASPTSTLYEQLNLAAAAYYNRFGLRAETGGTDDDLLDPRVPFARAALLEEVLGALVEDGVRSICFDQLQDAPRDSYGSPHFKTDTNCEITPTGGGMAWIAGVYDMLSKAGVDASANFPGDWLLGQVGLFSNNPTEIQHAFSSSWVNFPIDGENIHMALDLTVRGLEVEILGVRAAELDTSAYGLSFQLSAGDFLVLLPSERMFEIAAVDDVLRFESQVEISGDTHFRLTGSRKIANSRIAAIPFFTYAFGTYATVAADVTFLSNDMVWSEAVRLYEAGSVSEEEYSDAVTAAFRRSMYLIAMNCLAGNLPAISVQSEAMRRIPKTWLGHDLELSGSMSSVAQASQLFPTDVGPRPLLSWHMVYLRSITTRMREIEPFVRFGERAATPVVQGAASMSVPGVLVGSTEPTVVVGSSFRDLDGDIAMVFTCWATEWLVTFPQLVTSSAVFSDYEISTGYWTAVHMNQGQPNTWIGSVLDLDADPDVSFDFSFSFAPLETKLVLVYQQDVIVRRDSLGAEVDRVLVVPAGRSVSAALETIRLDVAKGGSGRYLVVVGAGAIADGLVIPSIPGATIMVQAVADERPMIEETV